jgi:MoaA/NifB/PqqE/SkfB family radical SAM enzyme
MEMVSPLKIFWHHQKVDAYLAGSPVFPVTLELGLTTACNRSCPDCPSRKGKPGLFLSIDTAQRLFSLCQGNTSGVILTGGEPTLHPDFGRILAFTREYGFNDIAVITNGSMLDWEEISIPLLHHASVVRISLYGWQGEASKGLDSTLRHIERLRQRIEKTGSKLQIGTSMLTAAADRESLGRVAAEVRAAGAHWIYFHPTCVLTPTGLRKRQSQDRVLDAMEAFRREQPEGFDVHYLADRFSSEAVRFQGFHAAHFILVVGADGANYLSSETKYQPRFRIASITKYGDDKFLWKSPRLEKIAAVHSENYPHAGSRNRGVLYNHVLEKAIHSTVGKPPPETPDFLFPHIL